MRLYNLRWGGSHHRNAVSLFNYEEGSCSGVVISKLNIRELPPGCGPLGIKARRLLGMSLRYSQDGLWCTGSGDSRSGWIPWRWGTQGMPVAPAPWQHEGLGPVFPPPCWNCFGAFLDCPSATCKAGWGPGKYSEMRETLTKRKHFKVCISWGYLKNSVTWPFFKRLA